MIERVDAFLRRNLTVLSLANGFLLALSLLSGCRDRREDLTWQRIQDQGSLRVAVDPNWVPFEYIDGSGQLAGFDVDLAYELGRRMGLDVDLITGLSFDGLFDGLAAGQADAIISAVVVDMGRSADFSYSTPYFDAGQVLVVGPRKPDIDNIEDLSGGALAVELGSEGDRIARHWARRLIDLSIWHTDSSDEAVAALREKRADAALLDRATALILLRADQERNVSNGEQMTESSELRIPGDPLTGEQYAVVVRREDKALLRAINDVLAQMRRDGTLEVLERKWLGP
jgi:glutamine transport system substrate-binding protein